ncbi:MAG: response regulator [Cyanobacteria bacterium P01_F01_bin.53]
MSRRILLIDDEEAISIIVTATLKVTAGWQVLSTTSGTEGIAIARAEQPDAILLDVSMPKRDGTEIFQALQAEPIAQKIPVIFLTAKARDSEQRLLKALGVDGLILKPFNPETLATQIKTLLHWSE